MIGPGRVLVVDDSEDDQIQLARLLSNEGQVIAAYSVAEALERLDRETFDVVVTDQNMPPSSGDELVRSIRADPRLTNVRCVLLSGQASDAQLVEILREGHLYRYFDKNYAFISAEGRVALQLAVRTALAASRLERDHALLHRRLAAQVEAVQAQYRLLRRLVGLRHAGPVLRAVVDSLAERIECDGTIGIIDLPSTKVGHWACRELERPPATGESDRWIASARAIYTRLSGRPLDRIHFDDTTADTGSPQHLPLDDSEVSIVALPVFVNRDLRGLLGVVREAPLAPDEEELLSVWRDQLQDALTRVHTERLDEQRRLELMVETMTEGVVMTDEHGAVTLANPAARQLLATQDLERSDFSLVVSALGLSSLDVLRQLGVGESKVAWREIQQDDAFLQVLFSHVRDQSGRFLGILTVIREVTVQKLAEQRREEFVHIIGHELRSPLTSIGGVLDLLGKKVLGELTSRQHEYVDMAKDSCVRINHILNDLLDLAKFEQGKMPLALEPVNLEQVVFDSVRKFEPVALEKGVILESECHLQGLFFQADAHRLGQVMTNLLSNALKFTDAEKRVSVSVFTAYCAPDHYLVSVHNEGDRIDDENLDRIFDKFEQVSGSSARRSVGGTGLGLSICRNIVLGHGGQIWVESDSNGTTFVFCLPCQGPAKKRGAGETPAPVRGDFGEKPLIIVAADRLEALALKGRLLELGFQVRICDAEVEQVSACVAALSPALAIYFDLDSSISAAVLDELAGFNDLPVVGMLPPGSPTPPMIDMLLEVPPDSVVMATTLNVVLSRQRQQRRLRVLIVDRDPAWAATAVARLDEAGYLAYVAGTTSDAVRRVEVLLPDVVIIDLGMSGADAVFAETRNDRAPIPCLFSHATAEDLARLDATEEDRVERDDELRGLPLRIRARLNRERRSGADAMFMLPGAREIQREAQSRMREKVPYAYCSIDIEGLRQGIDKFGFMWGHAAMVHTAELIQRVLREHADERAFLGHQRDDDFVFLVGPEHCQTVGREIMRAFDQVGDVIVGSPDGPELSLMLTAIVDHDGRFQRFSSLQAALSRARVRVERTSVVIERDAKNTKELADDADPAS